MAKKELVKGVWRADDWREFPAFQRALKRYLRLADAALLEYFEFWIPFKSLNNASYSFLQVNEQVAVEGYNEYVEKNKLCCNVWTRSSWTSSGCCPCVSLRGGCSSHCKAHIQVDIQG